MYFDQLQQLRSFSATSSFVAQTGSQLSFIKAARILRHLHHEALSLMDLLFQGEHVEIPNELALLGLCRKLCTKRPFHSSSGKT